MRTQPKECARKKKLLHESFMIQTTLFELIETVIDVIGTDKNHLIMPVLIDTLRKGKAKVIVSETISI